MGGNCVVGGCYVVGVLCVVGGCYVVGVCCGLL